MRGTDMYNWLAYYPLVRRCAVLTIGYQTTEEVAQFKKSSGKVSHAPEINCKTSLFWYSLYRRCGFLLFDFAMHAIPLPHTAHRPPRLILHSLPPFLRSFLSLSLPPSPSLALSLSLSLSLSLFLSPSLPLPLPLSIPLSRPPSLPPSRLVVVLAGAQAAEEDEGEACAGAPRGRRPGPRRQGGPQHAPQARGGA
eukprot:3097646-Rhodomonas_salina.1